MAHDKVANFIDKYQEHSKTKKRDLLESIETARKSMNKSDALILEKRLGGKLGGDQSTKKQGTTMMGTTPIASESSGGVTQAKGGQSSMQ